ncbi:MAG: ROK family protein [Tessaracoccus sp.]|uniref:ROK family transcriptional regulator n=1 Tax=Tessaracoccus sp. TaxID=1971211 RepID=UPI001ED5EA9E|nr:ROK family protein [Tessaracoccus sp.]MBK7822267.1 ROK family protein [Tessaracoccus sp.]
MEYEHHTRHRASTADVLGFAWNTDVFRADHVMAALGLTRSTALSALDALIDIGLVTELPNSATERNRMGRPARRFELNGDAGVVIGIDAGNRRFTAIAADLTGRVLAEEHLDIRGYLNADDLPYPDADPEERLAAALRVIDAVLAATRRTRTDVVGVGVGIPAPVDGDGESPPHESGFWQYMNAGLRRLLAEEFPAVRVENDAALAAIAESSLGEARGCDDFVAVLGGRRLGSGVFMEGRLVRGARGAVGELGGLTYITDVGGSWGLGYLAEKWVRDALEGGLIPADHPWAMLPTGEGLTAEVLLAHASLSDPVTRPLIEDLGLRLGRISRVVGYFYDPERIIVCGAVAPALGEVIEIAQRHVDRESELPPPEMVASQLGGDVVSLGAVSAAREAALEVVLPLLTARRNGAGGPGSLARA